MSRFSDQGVTMVTRPLHPRVMPEFPDPTVRDILATAALIRVATFFSVLLGLPIGHTY